MRSFTTLVSMALVAAAHPLEERSPLERRGGGGVCTGGPWASDAFIEPSNSPNGNPFCESGWSATTFVPISGVTAWTSDYYCTGIQFTYADGAVSQVYGEAGGGYAPRSISVNYALNERFTEVTTYGPPVMGVLHHLQIKANNGGHLNCGQTLTGSEDQYPTDVASGIMMGAQGKNAVIVDSIGFLFLRSAVSNVDVSNLTFPNGPTGSQGINPETLATGHYYNNQDTGNTTWTFTDQKQVMDLYTFTQQSANMYGNNVMVGFNIMIPLIGGIMASTQFTWSYTETYIDTTTHSETTSVTWGQSGSLAPHTGVDCSAVVGTGAGTYPYTSTVTLSLADGTKFTFQENGSLNLSVVSAAIVEVSPANHP